MSGRQDASLEPGHERSDNTDRFPRITTVGFTTHSGPLPHPEVLRRYEDILPGAAKQIFDDFALQSAHRRVAELTAIRSNAFSQIIGAVSSSLLGLMGVAGGLWLAHEGRALGGLSSVFATLASLVGVYIYQNRKQDHELRDKREESKSILQK